MRAKGDRQVDAGIAAIGEDAAQPGKGTAHRARSASAPLGRD